MRGIDGWVDLINVGSSNGRGLSAPVSCITTETKRAGKRRTIRSSTLITVVIVIEIVVVDVGVVVVVVVVEVVDGILMRKTERERERWGST